jgi:hypothetical protein
MRMFVVVVVLACGGKPHTEPQQHGDEHHDDHHAKLSPELVSFHDVLAPRWHAAPGPERVKATCDAIGELRARGDAVAKAAPPAAANADAWASGTKKLVAAIEGLAASCASGVVDGFDGAFARVHESFEALAE